ncbi:hypothetical protein ASE75_06120 [Sphingomonas sp. Leaf17]|nr:hypothetical protein ASE75_06120 [Sphingomonas sp. Leaf17]
MSDEERERRRERGRHIAKTVLQRPDVIARYTPEMRAAAGKKRTATTLAWCPPEYIDEYRHLTASIRLSAAEARAMIEDRIVADRRRGKAQPQPMSFEDKLARVAAGAQLVATPDTRRPDPAFTLGGIASAAF